MSRIIVQVPDSELEAFSVAAAVTDIKIMTSKAINNSNFMTLQGNSKEFLNFGRIVATELIEQTNREAKTVKKPTRKTKAKQPPKTGQKSNKN